MYNKSQYIPVLNRVPRTFPTSTLVENLLALYSYMLTNDEVDLFLSDIAF